MAMRGRAITSSAAHCGHSRSCKWAPVSEHGQKHRAERPTGLTARECNGVVAVLLAVVLHLASPSVPLAQTIDTAETTTGIAGNPGAVNVTPGTGALGRWLGLEPDSGLRLGGVLVSNGNILLAGGSQQGTASFNNFLLLDLEADLSKVAHIPGATFGVSGLRFDGQPTNAQAGTVTGYNGLTGAPPLDRTELYELWWRQSLFSDKLIIRIGKMVPTYDFGNVARPVPVRDDALRIPAVTGLLYTPVFVNPTILGAMPGYYNSAWGGMVTVAPNDQLYASGGIYDGNGANGYRPGCRPARRSTPTSSRLRSLARVGCLGPGICLVPSAQADGARLELSACPRLVDQLRRTAPTASTRSAPKVFGEAKRPVTRAASRRSCRSA